MGDYKLIRGHPGEYDGYHPAIVGETCTADPYGIKDEPIDFEVDPKWSCNDIYAVKAEGHVMLFDVMSKWYSCPLRQPKRNIGRKSYADVD